MASDDETTPPGWYRQQDDPSTLRWWDGDDWTDDTMPAPGADRPPRRAAGAQPAVRADTTAAAAESGDAAPADTTDDDWAAVAWEEGARTTEAPRIPAATPRAPATTPRTPAATGRTPTATPRAPAQTRRTPAATRIRQPATPEELARRGTGPRTDEPRTVRQPAATTAPPTRRPTPQDARRPTDASRPPGPARQGPGSRPAVPRAPRRPGDRTPPPRRRPGDDRPTRSGVRRDEQVVQRGKVAPPVVRVGLRAALIAVLLGVGYLAYTQIRDAEPERARTLSESESARPKLDPDAPRLDQVVLALKDLPRGWSAQAIDANVADDVCDGRVPLSVIEPLETTKAAFTMGEAGPFITNVVSTFADDGQAQAFLDLTARTVDSCRTYEVEGGTNVELGPLEFPNFGDASFVAEATGTSPYGNLAGDLIYVRVGRRVTSTETIAFGDSTLSPELVEHLTRLVANRME